jgi:hypothetical protein
VAAEHAATAAARAVVADSAATAAVPGGTVKNSEAGGAVGLSCSGYELPWLRYLLQLMRGAVEEERADAVEACLQVGGGEGLVLGCK